jgi:hypothetical protein
MVINGLVPQILKGLVSLPATREVVLSLRNDNAASIMAHVSRKIFELWTAPIGSCLSCLENCGEKILIFSVFRTILFFQSF